MGSRVLIMIMKRLAFVFFISCFGFLAQAGESEPILRIGEETFEAGEFWHVFNKNRHLSGFSESAEEFAERFINYKLKVVEARQRGLDTLPSFKSEFERYARELQASFLVDSAALNLVVAQAHSNMQGLVEASHILLELPEDAVPADTLAAWERINALRSQALSGSDFNELAGRHSEDPSAQQNKGYLGYFTAFRMIYPFEEAAFATPVDSISPVFRTRFGYHILKVHDRRPNPGKVRVAHLMKMFSQPGPTASDPQLETEINDLYRRLQEGAAFNELVRAHSDDRNSVGQDGEMPAFGWGEMIPEFAEAAFALEEDAAFSAPVRTDFGWHIIKRLELMPVGTLEEEYAYIMNMLGRDGRNNAGRHAFIEQRLNSSELQRQEAVLAQVYTALEGHSDKASFLAALGSEDAVLVRYRGEELSLTAFMERARLDEGFSPRAGRVAVDRLLEDLSRELVLETEKKQLAENNSDYRYLVNEYFDGLLIFEISSQEIWNEGASDSLALRTYYNEHLAEFTPAPKMTGAVCAINKRSLQRRVEKKLRKDPGATNVVQILKESARSPKDYHCESGQFAFVDDAGLPLDAQLLPVESGLREMGSVLYWEGRIEEAEAPAYEEVAGQVMNAYQQHLEEKWVKDLRERHQPQFSYSMLKK